MTMNRFHTAFVFAIAAAWPTAWALAGDLPTPADVNDHNGASSGPMSFEEVPPPVSALGDIGGSLEPIPHDEQLWEYEEALTESTGTWLRRGFWYVESEAVVLNRYWDRSPKILASDLSSGGQQDLRLDRSKPGAEGNLRLTLGRFLFRDGENRDHTMELTGFGGGEWSSLSRIASDVPNTLFVPGQLDRGNPSFDGASRMASQYDSRLTSFELNYRVRQRMGRDQMVMTPNGDWVRRASSGISKNFLVGLRYIDLTENLRWTADDIDATVLNGNTIADGGVYDVRTSNDVIGPQLGGGIAYETDRFSFEVYGKGGVMLNDAKGTSRLTVQNLTQGDLEPFYTNNREGLLTYVFQTGMIGRWHMRPNLSLRGGYELMYFVNMAMAPDQIKFDPEFSRVTTSGDPFYHGVTLGLEYFW